MKIEKIKLMAIKIKKLTLNIPHFIFTHEITRSITDGFRNLDIQSKIENWGISQYLYIFFFIPLSILTIMTLILLIEGQLFHLFGSSRCDINSFNIGDEYCGSYFALMLGITIVTTLQIYMYWHYVTSLKNRLFPRVM